MPEAGGAAGGAVVLWAQLSCVMGDEVQVWRVGGEWPGGAGEEISLPPSQGERAPQVLCSGMEEHGGLWALEGGEGVW